MIPVAGIYIHCVECTANRGFCGIYGVATGAAGASVDGAGVTGSAALTIRVAVDSMDAVGVTLLAMDTSV